MVTARGEGARPNASTAAFTFNPTTTMRIKSVLRERVFPYALHAAGVLCKLKSAVVGGLLGKKNAAAAADCNPAPGPSCGRRTRKGQQAEPFFFPTVQMHGAGTARPSSHVLPLQELPRSDRAAVVYYDSTWDSVICVDSGEGGGHGAEPQLPGYPNWAEEEPDDADEIDRLAEKFIASCHEKFRLERQESYRRYREMLARSV